MKDHIELKNSAGVKVATISATKQGVWIVLDAVEKRPMLAFDVEGAGLCLSLYSDSSPANANSLPAIALAVTDEDVRLQLSRPGKNFTQVSLFELLEQIS